jgi:hypothetical protein
MRGQTQLDFAIGVSIFLIVVASVLSFVPAMLEPFESSTQQETSAANRVADQLVGGTLGDAGEPYVLDRECTIVFFEDTPDNFDSGSDNTFNEPYSDSDSYSTSNCNFNNTEVVERVGLNTNPALNVRIHLERDLIGATPDDPDGDGVGDDDVRDILCLDTNDDRIVEANDPGSGRQCDPGGGNDVLFEIGGSPPSDTGSVVVARRTVSVDGGFADNTSDASLIVEVW